MAPHLVLAGGGHAHLFVLEALVHRRMPAHARVTLVSSSRHHVYSGMLPGFIGGRYSLEDILLDLGAIARCAGIDFIESPIDALAPADRSIRLHDGRTITYDLLSLAIGSDSAGVELPGVRDIAMPVKPIDDAPAIVDRLRRAVADTERQGPRVAVVGAGAGGIELALNLRARLDALGRGAAAVTIMDQGARILPDRSAATRRAAARVLAARDIATVLGVRVGGVEPGRLVLADERSFDADLIVWSTGPSAPALLRRTGLALDEHGYVRVDRTLRSLSHPEVFAAGDVASLEIHPAPPKSGVYAVREGPVLRDNLATALRGGEGLRRYHPQRRFLALLNTGDGRAICSYGRLAATGRWAMRLKDRIDRRFMRRFRRLERFNPPPGEST